MDGDDRDTVILPLENVCQEKRNWCWLAVAQQAIRWKRGESPAQEDLAAWVIGNRPELWDRGGSLEEIQELIGDWGLTVSVVERPTAPARIYEWLAGRSPVILAVDTSPRTSHVVILRGMVWQDRQERAGAHRQSPLFIINDPLLRAGYSLAVTWAQLQKSWKASVVVL